MRGRKIAPLGICIDAIENCLEYDIDGNCKKCYRGYYLEDNRCELCSGYDTSDGYNCIDNCRIINLEGTCKACFINYYLDGTECKLCEENKISNGTVCFEKIENCDSYNLDEYSGIPECSKCIEGYYINENGDCVQCIDGIIVTAENRCYTKIANCKSQNSDICNECEDDYTLSEDQKSCGQCPSDKVVYNGQCFSEIDYCLAYSDNICIKCSKGFGITPDGKCKYCRPPYYLASGITPCLKPRYLCKKHNEQGNCIHCEGGFRVNSRGDVLSNWIQMKVK